MNVRKSEYCIIGQMDDRGGSYFKGLYSEADPRGEGGAPGARPS